MRVLRLLTFILLTSSVAPAAEPSPIPEAPRGDREGTIEDRNGVVLADPKDDSALAGRAVVHFQRGEVDEALEDAHRAIWMNANNGRAYAVLADIAQQKGFRESAILYRDAALSADMARRDIDEGFRVANRALEINPEDGFAYAVLAAIADKNGDKEGAAAKYQQAIEVAPRFVLLYTWRASFRETKGDIKGALEDLTKAVEIDPQNTSAIYDRGRLRDRGGDEEGALADFTEAIERNPKFTKAYGFRGSVRYKKGDADGALNDFNEAIDLAPESYLFFNRAIICNDRRDVAGALAGYSKAIELNPASVGAYQNRGNLREKMGDDLAAAADYSKLVASSPANSAYRSRRGWLNYCTGKYGPAVDDFNEILAVNPKDYWTHCARAEVLAKNGDVASALKDYDAAIAANPSLSYAYMGRAMLLHEKKEEKWALDDFATAASHDSRSFESYGHYEFGRMWAGLCWGDSALTLRYARSFLEGFHDDEGAGVALILGYIALRKQHQDAEASAWLEEWVAPLKLHSWPNVIVEQLRQGKSFDDLLPLVTSVDSGTEIHVYAGIMDLANGQPDAARRHFVWVRLVGNPAYLEKSFAIRMLGELKETENDDGSAEASTKEAAITACRQLLADEKSLPKTPAPGAGTAASIRAWPPKVDPPKKAELETPALLKLEAEIKAVEQKRPMRTMPVSRDLGDNWQAYVSRGQASETAGDLAGAVADFTKAVELNGGNSQSYIFRGNARQTAGDLAGAVADFTKAVELNGDNARGYDRRGYARQAMGDTNGALADYRQFCAMSETGQDYPRLYIWVIRQRLGETDAADAELEAYIGQHAKAAPSIWVAKVAEYLLGDASEADLFVASKSPDLRTERGQTCEAWYYIAVKKLLESDKAGAADALRKCLATAQKDYYEYQFARAELKDLAP